MDDDFEALPIQRDEVYELTPEQRVPEPDRWMSWAEKREWYRQDLLNTIGAEYIGKDDGSDQPFMLRNMPKRSSRQKKK